MKLSIIVPVYNMVAGEKLEFCLNSLTNQTLSDYEIIAVNDASTDDSLIVLNWYKNHKASLGSAVFMLHLSIYGTSNYR